MRKHGRNQHAHVYGSTDRLLLMQAPRVTLNQAMAALSQVGSVVYAMRVPGGLVKIGCTAQLDQRRLALKGEMLAFQFGDLSDEQALHARLVDHRHHGLEWYYPTPGVLAVVNEMRDALGLEPIAA